MLKVMDKPVHVIDLMKDWQYYLEPKNLFTKHVFAFFNFGFSMSDTMSDNLVLCVTMCYLCLYMYEFENSFTNISGSNGLILIKCIQLFQQVIQSLNTSFQGILLILQSFLILDFN